MLRRCIEKFVVAGLDLLVGLQPGEQLHVFCGECGLSHLNGQLLFQLADLLIQLVLFGRRIGHQACHLRGLDAAVIELDQSLFPGTVIARDGRLLAAVQLNVAV
ncbi:hypothetical protein [Xenorhabdus cabanillasii]|uniref:hypothetical protein n=1 Tax=Xenorhabdus cabanillasii TaxID=351673 RepID=UPI001FD337CB|nr:hypothetical protein [Xenorhabdus cabanillasii]